MPFRTDWQPIATDTTYENPVTRETEYSWKWTQYNDDQIAVNLSDAIADTEVVTGLTTHLVQLPAITDVVQDPVDADDKFQGSPPTLDGTIVRQRMSDLTEVGRVYRLYVGVGDPGNHRIVTTVIEVVG